MRDPNYASPVIGPPVAPVPPVPMTEPEASPISPPLKDEPLTAPENVPIISEPVINAPTQVVGSPVFPPQTNGESIFSDKVYWISVFGVLLVGIFAGAAVTSLICAKKLNRLSYSTIQSDT